MLKRIALLLIALLIPAALPAWGDACGLSAEVAHECCADHQAVAASSCCSQEDSAPVACDCDHHSDAEQPATTGQTAPEVCAADDVRGHETKSTAQPTNAVRLHHVSLDTGPPLFILSGAMLI